MNVVKILISHIVVGHGHTTMPLKQFSNYVIESRKMRETIIEPWRAQTTSGTEDTPG